MEIMSSVCVFLIFFALLLYVSIVDIKERVIHNWVIFSTVFLWIIWRIILLSCSLLSTNSMQNAQMIISDSLMLAASSFAILVILLIFTSVSERLADRYLFGGGDIKLIATTTLYLGIELALVAVFLASIISLIYALAKLPKGIPFAPCMLCGSLLALLI